MYTGFSPRALCESVSELVSSKAEVEDELDKSKRHAKQLESKVESLDAAHASIQHLYSDLQTEHETLRANYDEARREIKVVRAPKAACILCTAVSNP